MIALKTIDLRNDFKKVSDLVNSGETVLISRPRNENIVVISEKEYNELEKNRRNTEYISMIDKSAKEVEKGKVITFSMDEIDAMESMVAEDVKAYVTNKQNGKKV